MNFEYKTEPWAHQVKALEYLSQRKSAALYTNMGTGKTKIMIDLIQNKGFRRVVVVCPKKACKVWIKEIEKHGIEGKIRAVDLSEVSNRSKGREALNFSENNKRCKSLVFVINYDTIWSHPIKNVLKYKKLGIDTVICDESHRIKSPSAKCSRYLTQIGKRVENRFLMTGTPLAENPIDVYAQYRFLDPSIFGTNYNEFRDRYENLDPIKTMRTGHRIVKASDPYKNLDELKEKMFSCAFKDVSSVELPKTKSKVTYFELGKKARKFYLEYLKDGAIELEDNFSSAENILTLSLRLQQLLSGVLNLEDYEGSSWTETIDYARMFALKKILENTKDRPIVVFAKFKVDFQGIKKVCKKLGLRYGEISGSRNDYEDWLKGNFDLVAVQYASGAESIDLTLSNVIVFYSLENSLMKYKQARKRVHRPNQTRKVTYIHLCGRVSGVPLSEDEKIILALKRKQNIVKFLMKNPPI